MIDQTLLIDDFDTTLNKLQRKGVGREEVVEARDALIELNSLLSIVEEMRATRNSKSKQIGIAMSEGDEAKAEQLKKDVNALKDEMLQREDELKLRKLSFRDKLLRLPNLPSDDAPVGNDEEDNVVLRTIGYYPNKYVNKSYVPHWDLGENLGILDKTRAAKITGSMFAILRGDGAKLLRALVNFTLDLNSKSYVEHIVPTFVNSQTFTATGHLPKFENDAYGMSNDDLWAIPTGEVPLTAMHRDEILDISELPKRYMTYTSCFRREAGSAGKETRGMQRLHEFHKVELVRLCDPQNAQSEFEELLEDAIRPLALLELPYRIVDLCTGDLTFSSSRIFDIEVYSPGVDNWLEVSSVGLFTDYQMRRGNIRFKRDAKSKTEFPYALNGSAIATPRVWAAIVEHYQQPDGTIKVPKALKPYLNVDVLKGS